jgi:hypothetical protein
MRRLLLVIICLLLLVGCGKKVDESLSGHVTIDINPSLEIDVKDGKVEEIKDREDDPSGLVNSDMKGKKIQEVFEEIVSNAKEKGFIESGELFVIFGYEDTDNDSKDRKSFEDIFRDACVEQDVHVKLIVPEITEEAIHESQGRGVSPAKAAYILELLKENEELHFDDLKNKPASELIEIQDTGMYCHGEYTLKSGKCEKVVKEEAAKEGKKCPEGYEDVKGKCYKTAAVIDEEGCENGFILKEGKCVGTEKVNATPAKYSCSKGTAKTRYEAGLTGKNAGDANDIVCVDTSKATHPVSPCELNDGTEWTKANGKCYWHRAGILPSGCPGKVQVNGACWDDASKVLICKGARDGKQYSSRSEYCEGSVKYTNPTVSGYKCNSGYTLSGTKCLKEVTRNPITKHACERGLTLYQDRICLNYKETSDYVTGLTCSKDARLEGEKCVYYEVEDALRK